MKATKAITKPKQGTLVVVGQTSIKTFLSKNDSNSNKSNNNSVRNTLWLETKKKEKKKIHYVEDALNHAAVEDEEDERAWKCSFCQCENIALYLQCAICATQRSDVENETIISSITSIASSSSSSSSSSSTSSSACTTFCESDCLVN